MPGRGKKITDEERVRIIDLYRNNLVMREVAQRVGRSYGAVNLVLHQEGEPIRARGGYHRETSQ
jgi:transposase